jgi:ATPase subunit of ABC transporter with duplicated ATPase domains
VLTATNLSKAFGGQVLFDACNLQLLPGCRYGIVGANGAGKSTLLRILSGEESASTGEVIVPRRARLGVLGQDHFAYEDTRIIDVVMMGAAEAWTALRAHDRMVAAAEAGEAFDADAYARVEDDIARLGGYALEARAAEILEGLNIGADKHASPLRVLSGGYKLRVLLGQVLAGDPDVLLLDEPTNHLDILSVAWLERFLLDYRGCAIVVSHDHRFLDTVCTHILDVDYQAVTQYKGNYTAFNKAKDEERARRQLDIERRKEEIEDHKDFINRFKAKATKARQANSRAKQMARIVIDVLPESSRRYPFFRFTPARPSGREVLTVKGVWKAYGEQIVLADVNFEVRRGERVAIIGPNGIGKSTLLKVLMGLTTADSGTTAWGYEVRPGWFAQDHKEVLNKPEDTLKSWLWSRVPSEGVGFVHSKLAEVLFSNEEVDKKIGNLSGGEAARLVFATIGCEQPNVLVLDEPTNHLDLEGIEALAKGIEAFEGTVVFVSHDRWFVGRLATRVIDLTVDGITDHEGTYDEYLARQAQDRLDREAVIALAREAKRDQKADQRANKVEAAASGDKSAADPTEDKGGGDKKAGGIVLPPPRNAKPKPAAAATKAEPEPEWPEDYDWSQGWQGYAGKAEAKAGKATPAAGGKAGGEPAAAAKGGAEKDAGKGKKKR